VGLDDLQNVVNPKILVSSDWHVGHSRVPTSDTIGDIRKYLLPHISKVNIVFFPGDIFDGLISMNSPDASLVIDLFVDIFRLCFEYDVILRIVRGTYSHDILQNNIISRLFDKLQIPVDYQLINNMSVECIEKYGLNILYMPDNLPYRTKEEALDNAKMLLCANNMTYVDYVVMHGEFDHLDFHHASNTIYNSDHFSFCTKLILAGHIHKPHRYRNLVYAGSFNRLAHNEEEPKGFWIIEGTYASFVENKDATRFITIDYRTETNFDEMLQRHVKIIERFDPERLGFLRLLLTDTNLKQAIANYHNANYPNIKLTFKHVLKSGGVDDQYLAEKLKQKNIETLPVPSLKNVANIVCNHLFITGISIEITEAESIINGS